jgi:hypothetical protein
VFDQALGFLSKTQIWEDCCNRPDDMDSRLDAFIHKASIAIQIQTSRRQSSWSGRASIRSAVRTTILPIRTREASIWNYLQRTCDCPDNRATLPRRSSQTRKIFSEIFRILVVQLSIRTMPSFIKPDAHLNCLPINRGP